MAKDPKATAAAAQTSPQVAKPASDAAGAANASAADPAAAASNPVAGAAAGGEAASAAAQKAGPAKASAGRKLRVLSTIEHDGKRHGEGAKVTVEPDQAEALVAGGSAAFED